MRVDDRAMKGGDRVDLPLRPSRPTNEARPTDHPRWRGFLLLLLLAPLVHACGGGPSPIPSQLPVPAQRQDVLGPVSPASRLYSDNTGGFMDSTRIVVLDENEWSRVWDQATSHQVNPLPRPAVDFAESMVVVVAAGRMTPEDQIRVDSVGVRSVRTESGDLQDVFEVVVRTVEGCGRLRVDAYPFEIVRTDLFDGPVRFVERRSMAEGCRNHP
jgi:hypothetical protein